MRDPINGCAQAPTDRELHDAIAAALQQQGTTYSGIQLAVREVQKLYASLVTSTGLAAHWKERHDLVLRKHMECCGAQAVGSPLQAIHDAVNALGGRPDQDNSYDQGIVDTVNKVLEIIEKAQAASLVSSTNQPAPAPHARVIYPEADWPEHDREIADWFNSLTGKPDEADWVSLMGLLLAPAPHAEVRAETIEAGAQALANDVWHPPQRLESLPRHDINKFRRQARLVLEAAALAPQLTERDAQVSQAERGEVG